MSYDHQFLTCSIFDPYQLRSEFLEVAGTLLNVLLRPPQGNNVLALTGLREGNLQKIKIYHKSAITYNISQGYTIATKKSS